MATHTDIPPTAKFAISFSRRAMSITVNGYHFTFSLWLCLVSLLSLWLLLSLGDWQLTRAGEKRMIEQAVTHGKQQKVLSLSELPAPNATNWSDYAYRQVVMHGHFLNQYQFILDNETHEGQVGYHIISVFQPNGQTAAVLVDRGWVALVDHRRTELPHIAPINGLVTLTGMLYLPPSPFLLSHAPPNFNKWPVRIQAVQIEPLSNAIGSSLYPWVMLLSPQVDNGFVRDWHMTNISSTRHIAYAIQWFAFAGILLIIVIKITYQGR